MIFPPSDGRSDRRPADNGAELRQTLPAEPSSVALARQSLVDALGDWQGSAVVEVAELLVSELVTNAVLHAGSAVELAVWRQAGRVRVEVGDASAMVPHQRVADETATIGRGVDMVEMLAERWGVDTSHAEGKIVWFEVSAAASEAPSPDTFVTTPAGPPVETEPPDASTEVRLHQAPVRLMTTMQQHTETLLREVTLRSVEETESWTPVRLGIDFDELDRQLRAATLAGRTVADLGLHAPEGSAPMVRQAAETLSYGDRLAADGFLLCPPALPEIADCRRWFLDQLIDQLEGRPAEPWQPRATPAAAAVPEVDHSEVLDRLAQAVVVADDQDRIAYINPAGASLLGWPAGELEGQRLTSIIPERLHHAHVAGYTRYLTTGEPRLIGTAVKVPARRRDGSEVDVELSLSAFRAATGQALFAAVLHREAEHAVVAPGDGSSGREPRLVDRVRSVLEASQTEPPEERRRQVLAALAGELGWHFAAWWVVDDGVLRCVTAWQHASQLDALVAATFQQRFAAGRGLPGRVWSRQRPAWIADLVADANFPRLSVALDHGLRSGCAFPVPAGDRLVGVIELLTTSVHPPDDGLMASLAEVGELVGDLA